MKKTALLLFAAALVLTLGAFAQDQEKTPPPAKPAAGTALPPQTPRPPQAVKPAQTAPAAVAPAGLTVPAAPMSAEAMALEQTPPPTPAAQTAPAAKPEKAPAMRTELIKLKYADMNMIYGLLRAYRSPWGNISPTGGADKTIVATDTPEIIEKMLSIVRELDVKPAEIQFTVQLVQGAETEGPGDEALKNDPVIRELRSVLKYKSFSLLDGTLMRVIDGERAETKIGPKGEYSIRLQPIYSKDGAAETVETRIEFFRPEWISQQKMNTETKVETREMLRFNNDLIQTTLQLKIGDKSVVGVSKSDADKGLILILSAKVVK